MVGADQGKRRVGRLSRTHARWLSCFVPQSRLQDRHYFGKLREVSRQSLVLKHHFGSTITLSISSALDSAFWRQATAAEAKHFDRYFLSRASHLGS